MRALHRKICIIFLITLVFKFIPSPAWSLTPGEIFEDGKRAFLLGHWLEAREQFQKFNHSWPTHSLAPESLYFGTLAEIRMGNQLDVQLEKNRIASYTEISKLLSERLPKADLTELEVAILLLKANLGDSTSATPEISSKDTASMPFIQLSPEKLGHAISQGWLPSKNHTPFQTLKWILEWESKHSNCPLDLAARLSLLKAKALWKFCLAPLPTEAFMNTLKSWGVWPVQQALYRSLKEAFKNGGPEIKREAALLGICSEHLISQQQFRKKDRAWLRYLQERGIYFSEGWCPE